MNKPVGFMILAINDKGRCLMLNSLKVFLLCIIAGAVSWFMWLTVIMFGSGDSNPLTGGFLYASGIAIAAAVGFGLGSITKEKITGVPAILGWILSAPLSPITLYLSNPAQRHHSAEYAAMLSLVACAIVLGIAGTIIGARYHNNRKAILITSISGIISIAIFMVILSKI